jgi:hypothetical protein
VIEVKIKTVKLSEIKLNPDNPRTISKKDMALLIKSLKDFPDMLKLREIVVDETMTVLGGNMRLLALVVVNPHLVHRAYRHYQCHRCVLRQFRFPGFLPRFAPSGLRRNALLWRSA